MPDWRAWCASGSRRCTCRRSGKAKSSPNWRCKWSRPTRTRWPAARRPRTEALRRALAQLGDWDKLGTRNRRLRRTARAAVRRGRAARSALRAALLPAEPGVHRDRGADAGVRHRRQYRHLHDGGRAGAARAALSRAGPADGDRDAKGAAAGRSSRGRPRADFFDFREQIAGVLLDGRDQPGVERGDDGPGRGGTTGCAVCLGGILPDAGRQAVAGPHLRAGGGSRDAAFECSGAVARFLAAAVRRQPRGDWGRA